MEFAYFYVNLEQIHLPLFTDTSEVTEMYRVANKCGLKMAREKLVGGNLLLGKIRWGWEGREESSMKCASWECNRKQFQPLRYVCSSEVLKKAASKIRCTLRKLKLVFIEKLAIERRHLRGCEQSQGQFGAPLRG